jgi:hypothetical protein
MPGETQRVDPEPAPQTCPAPAAAVSGELVAGPAPAVATPGRVARRRGADLSAAGLLELQRTAGNRAVLTTIGQSRRLQRATKSEGTPGNRPDLVVGDTGPAVTLLQSRLIRYVTRDALPLSLSGVLDPDTLDMLDLFAAQYGTGSSARDVFATTDELETLKGEAVPKTKTFDDLSEAHKAEVASIVNRHMSQAFAVSHRPDGTPGDLRECLITARNSVTAERNGPGDLTLNITLRDAQRYLYGRLAPYTDSVALKNLAGGVEVSTFAEIFHHDPSDTNIRGAILATEEYENAKSQTDVRTSAKPASALGGIPYFNKGIADSDKDIAGDRWKKDLAPDKMDTSNIGGSPAPGRGAFPTTGAAGSEEA